MAGLDWDEELTRATGKLITSLVRLTSETETTRNTKMPARKSQQSRDRILAHIPNASEDTYRAVVYARYGYYDGSISTNIVAAKTRVAPSKATSIPRLELIGAVIGVRLSPRVS